MIRVKIERCTGCRRCETSCAFFHTGKISRHLSRIKVMQLYESGIDCPVVCCQCQERYCLKCPEKALSVGHWGQIVLSPTRCNLCGACEKNCPVGALEIFGGLVFVCDLCGGRPRCVDACTEEALVWDVGQGDTQSLKERTSGAWGKSPREKREAAARIEGKTLRELWRKNA